MAIMPLSSPMDWRKRLPVSVVDWIEQDLHRSFADLAHIRLEAKPLPIKHMTASGWSSMPGPDLTHYTFTFQDGASFETDTDPLSRLRISRLIDGYNEIISAHLWIDRYIMQEKREEGEAIPNYGQTDIAYRVVSHLFKRGENDALALRFAKHLVNDASVEDDALVTLVKLECMAMKYTASEICTAAYRAFNELEWEQYNG